MITVPAVWEFYRTIVRGFVTSFALESRVSSTGGKTGTHATASPAPREDSCYRKWEEESQTHDRYMYLKT